MLRTLGSTVILMATISVLAIGGSEAFADQPAETLPAESIQSFPIPSPTTYANALAPDSEGNIWFTELPPYDGLGTSVPGKIDRLGPTGILTGEYPVPFEDPAYPELPSGPGALAVDTHDDVWFTDDGYNSEGQYEIGYVTPAGTLHKFKIATLWSSPVGIALGPDGAMWFTEQGVGKIGRATKLGIQELPISWGAYPVRGEYHEPSAIALGSDGNMWFTDIAPDEAGQASIGRVTPAGALTEYPIPVPYNSPIAIALGSDGDMWFTESPNGIGRISPAGEISEFAAPGISGSPQGIALGADGNMWFTESNGDLGRITPSGVVTNFSTGISGDEASSAIARGGESSVWYIASNREGREGRIVRVAIPFAPANEIPPLVFGAAVEGQPLSASVGSWAHSPGAFAYQWQDCDPTGANCVNLAGQTEATYLLGAGDVGHTLRAVVSASNFGGTATAMSNTSAVVQAAPHTSPPPLSPKLARPIEPLPVVTSPMTWNFGWARAYTVVSSLVVRNVPVGGLVEVTCHGGGCSFARWRSNTAAPHAACKHRHCKTGGPILTAGKANLAELFKGHRLKVGTRIVVTVSEAGWIGKSFVFTVRANRPPQVQITCLGSGPSNPTGGC
jgi:streptogramin lyase